MTEAEWLTCRSPQAMIRGLGKRLTGRRRMLFLVGVGHTLWDHLSPPARTVVGLQEQLAEGEIEVAEYRERQAAAYADILPQPDTDAVEGLAAHVVIAMLSYQSKNGVRAALEYGEQAAVLAAPECLRPQARQNFSAAACDLLRELFPPPGCEYVVQPDFVGGGLLLPDGGTFQVSETARAIAVGVQRDQAFDRLPILADALEDAGCPDRPLLDHLRHGTHHRRGCWALDLVLGRG